MVDYLKKMFLIEYKGFRKGLFSIIQSIIHINNKARILIKSLKKKLNISRIDVNIFKKLY